MPALQELREHLRLKSNQKKASVRHFINPVGSQIFTVTVTPVAHIDKHSNNVTTQRGRTSIQSTEEDADTRQGPIFFVRGVMCPPPNPHLTPSQTSFPLMLKQLLKQCKDNTHAHTHALPLFTSTLSLYTYCLHTPTELC